MSVTNTFKNRSGSIPLSELDTNFSELDVRSTNLEGRATSLENRTTAVENRAASLEGKIVGLNHWTITESAGGVLQFKYDGAVKFSIDSSGNISSLGNITEGSV